MAAVYWPVAVAAGRLIEQADLKMGQSAVFEIGQILNHEPNGPFFEKSSFSGSKKISK